jgi:hypothetical protein
MDKAAILISLFAGLQDFLAKGIDKIDWKLYNMSILLIEVLNILSLLVV